MMSGFRFLCALALVAVATARAQRVPDAWLTDYERSGFTRTPRYAETMAYCRRLEHASGWIKVLSFGKSAEGRDLPLVIASRERAFDPRTASSTGKAVVLIQNGIHAGEIDGKDACLMLLRDIAITKTKASLLDHAILLVIPIYNVDGHERFGPYNRINQNGPEEMGWRVTAQNLNLNRDYLKADAPETQAWLKLFGAWLPDFFVDCHVTDGADYQHVVTYTVECHQNVASPLRTWVQQKYLPMLAALKTGDVPVAPYIFLRDNADISKGLWGGTSPPRFSTSYVALQNRAGLLIETHMLKPYRARVEGTYQMLDATLRCVNSECASLKSAVRASDEQTARGVERPFPLQFNVSDAPSDSFHYFGFKSIVKKSAISGTDQVIFTDQPLDAVIPHFDSVIVKIAVVPPAAYLIPPEWATVIDRLRLHGVRMERLTKPASLEVELYKFSDVHWQEAPYEGRHPVQYKVDTLVRSRTFPPGTIVVRLNQRAARVALHALEPRAPDSFVAWGFFDAVFEQKEYAEDYVMERVAEQMLHDDSTLRAVFSEKLATDTAFARSPSARLNFFYQHSPYWDDQKNLYPVARLMSATPLTTEPLPVVH